MSSKESAEWPCSTGTKNALRITDEGRVLRDEAELVLKQYGQLDDIVKNLSTSRKFIRVSFSTLSGNQVYPKLLRVFTELRKTGGSEALQILLEALAHHIIGFHYDGEGLGIGLFDSLVYAVHLL